MDSMTLDQPSHPPVLATARLDAASVQASVLDYVGTVATLDFRSRPWVPGQPSRLEIGERLKLDVLTASLKPVAQSATLMMLNRGPSAE